MKKYIIISTLGFDERPVIRSLASIGFRDVEKIVLIRPYEDDQRAVKAVSEIKKIASMASLRDEDIVSYRVDVYDYWLSISMIYNLYMEYVSLDKNIIVCLGGGLRALVLEAYTALILLPNNLRRSIIIRIDLETGKNTIVLRGEEILTSLEISSQQYRVLELLEDEPGLYLSKISYEIDKPVSTTYRVLKKLVEQGYIEKRENRYYLTSKGKALLNIKKMLENS